MTSPRPAAGLRSLLALALAAPAACAIENPGFIFDTTSTRTGTDTASSAGTTGAGTTGTGAVDTGATTEAVTGPGPTSTTVSTLPPDTTTTDATTVGESAPETSGGCTPMETKIQAEADGFYIAGGTLGGTTCDYIAKINETQLPCKDLNFGVTPELRIARGANTFDAMYVVRFAKPALAELKGKGITSATAELVLSMFAAPPAVDMRVGMIKDQWEEGSKDGMLALEGDSSFANAVIGVLATPWSHPDGPRGASIEVATLSVPANYPDPSFIESESFPIDAWLAAPEQAEGLVVSFPKNDAVGTEGPSIHTRDAPNALLHPFLRIHYCLP